MMIELLMIIVGFTCVWVLGLTIVTQDGMAFGFIRDRLTDDRGNPLMKIYEPLILCEWCMPSIHGIFGYAFAIGLGYINEFNWKLVLIYPLVVALSSFIVGMLWSVYLLLEAIRKYADKSEKLLHINYKDKVNKYKNRNHENNRKIRNTTKEVCG